MWYSCYWVASKACRMTKEKLAFLYCASNFIFLTTFNTILLICLKDSTGCASHLQMGIYKRDRGTHIVAQVKHAPTSSPVWGPMLTNAVTLKQERRRLCFCRRWTCWPPASGICLWSSAAHAGILVFLWPLEEILETNPTELRWMLLPLVDAWNSDSYAARKCSFTDNICAAT